MKTYLKQTEDEKNQIPTFFQKNKIHIFSLFLKIFLVFYGEYQDNNFQVKFTDIDYLVYNDAARYVVEGKSPYLRHTYRYTPLLAYICTIDVVFYHFSGKILFTLIDSLSALILEKILKLSTEVTQSTLNILIGLWIFNPLSLTVSTRGNADGLISFMVLLVLYLLLTRKYILSGIFFGLVVHFKIYPILYALPIYFYIDRNENKGFFTKNRLIFTFVSAGIFIFLIGIFYYNYGYEFLFETYLYHLTRKDNRHNFSVYFYYIYLNFENVSKIQSILAFLPQITLVILSGVKFYKDLPFCCFMQTFWFVVFNKVCTAQYFVWYMSLLPLILVKNNLFIDSRKRIKFIFLWILWLISEILWNLGAHCLEHLGINVFIYIWIACILFFIINVILGEEILKEQNVSEFEIYHEKEN